MAVAGSLFTFVALRFDVLPVLASASFFYVLAIIVAIFERNK